MLLQLLSFLDSHFDLAFSHFLPFAITPQYLISNALGEGPERPRRESSTPCHPLRSSGLRFSCTLKYAGKAWKKAHASTQTPSSKTALKPRLRQGLIFSRYIFFFLRNSSSLLKLAVRGVCQVALWRTSIAKEFRVQ